MDVGDPRSTRTTLAALSLVIALLGGLVLLPRVFARTEAPLVGRKAPDFSLSLVANGEALGGDGSTLSVAQLRGRAVVLDFWATWCGPCRVEGPILDAVSRRWRDRGVVVVGVDTDLPDQGDPREFAVAHGLTYPMVHDRSGEASRLYGIDSLPTLVVLSRTGKVIAVRMGVTDDHEIEHLLRLALD
jgi:cytochrome c biogenesis protein CcmG, thiol:disulfide interchange protein DsbE